MNTKSENSPRTIFPPLNLLLFIPFLAALLMIPSLAGAEGRLVPIDLEMKAPLRQVKIISWLGRPAVLVLVKLPKNSNEGKTAGWQLSLVRLTEGRLDAEVEWELPEELRWIEPIELSNRENGWLALIGEGWYLGRAEMDSLRWTLLCRCQTLFSMGKGRLPFQARFAVDLDGDGVSEVLLPHWNGLVVYRLSQPGERLQPLWRVHWDIRERYDISDERMKVTLDLPRYTLKDADQDGVLDFISIGRDSLSVTSLPKPAPPEPGPFYVMDSEKLGRLKRLELPKSLLAALEKMKRGSYRKKGEFIAALQKTAKNPIKIEEAQLKILFKEVMEEIPVLFPAALNMPALGKTETKEKHNIQNVEDMDGDGALDLIHVKSTEKTGILDQKNQLRWYQGSLSNGNLGFIEKPQIFFSEGPAFSKLVYPRVNSGSLPEMFLATTEVSLLAIVRAFTLNTVSLDLFIYPWREGKLVIPPPYQGTLTFELKNKKKKNRPMVFLADLNGDGWREYIFNLDTDSLSAYLNGPEGPDLSGDPMAQIDLPIPYKPDRFFVGDLDGDQREELILWYARAENDKILLRTLRVLRFEENGVEN